jgi:hypothetical protein
VVLRVGASLGLYRIVPGDVDGSSALAADLIFEYAPEHILDARAEGAKVLLGRSPRSPFSTEELASSARYKGLVDARAVDSNHILINFQDAAAASQMVDAGDLGFDVGPFAIEVEQTGLTRLRRRSGTGIDVIEISQVSSADEWRKFLARELDVLPSSPSLYQDQFASLGSVRLLDIPPTASVALLFNVRDPGLDRASVRRRLAAGLHREAIARVVGGDPSSAAEDVTSNDGEGPLPERLSLLVAHDDSTTILASSVIRHQLDRLHVALDVVPVSLKELLARIDTGQYQLVLAQLPMGERYFERFLSPLPERPSLTYFADPTYDAAVAGKDFDRAQAILDRELPATVLYEWRTFAAMDKGFCAGTTPSATSWAWMAGIHRCGDSGEDAEDKP